MRTTYWAEEGSALVSGFDHSSAWFNWFSIVAVSGLYLLIPVVGIFGLSWAQVLALALTTAAGLGLISLLMRYSVRVLPASVILERTWAGVVYKRVLVPNAESLRFEVWGTGDWGDDGVWPAKHYCELLSPGVHDLMFGNPREADQLASWLTLQAQRLANRDLSPPSN